MALKLETLDGNATLDQLQAAIRQFEALGFELITFSKGLVLGAQSNTATFRDRDNAPGPLTLVSVDKMLALPAQQAALNAGESGGKSLVSYAVALVQGNETNVAAYRG
jgi:hypothetical protein